MNLYVMFEIQNVEEKKTPANKSHKFMFRGREYKWLSGTCVTFL